jgi:CheY-like chemotaxis protein
MNAWDKTLLIVEDDEIKRTQLAAFVHDVVPEIQVILERSLQSGLRRVRQSPPDVVLLDMSLPNYDQGPEESGGLAHALGGLEFLRQLDRFDMYLPIIVVTQFETFGKAPNSLNLDQLDQQLRTEYGENYKGLVKYDTTVLGWRERLQSLLWATLR